MAKNENDARVIQTKHILRKVGIDLLARHVDFSIRSLLEQAKITKGTFYRHYRNKADFIHDINQYQIDKTLGNFQGKFQALAVIESVGERAAFYNAALNEGANPDFHAHLLEESRAQVGEQLLAVDDHYHKQALAYQWEALMVAFWALVSRWLANNMDLTPMQLLTEFEAIFQTGMGSNSQSAIQWVDFSLPT